MGVSRPLLLLFTTLALSAGAPAGARSPWAVCGPRGYAYAGLVSPRHAYGVAGILSAAIRPVVERGHVAGWIGVGAPGEGPGGSDEWLQVGLNTIAGKPATVYYEVARPRGIEYVEVAARIRVGRKYHLAVVEMAGHADMWRVWINNRPASPPIWLPRSRGTLTPMAIAERWADGRPACDRYEYRFDHVSIACRPGGAWTGLQATSGRILQGAGSRVVPTRDGFVARTVGAPRSGGPAGVSART
jgi:hypothetical protein